MGELSTAAVYISEISPKETLGYNLSWISVSGAFGAWTVAALVIFLIESGLSKEDMLMWGWRLPYLTSLIPGAGLILARAVRNHLPARLGGLRRVQQIHLSAPRELVG